MSLKILVCGGRDFFDDALVHATLNRFEDVTEVIEGGANGADMSARRWAYKSNIKCRTFYADWKAHGRAAGPIRNRQMIDEGNPDLVIAFPGGRGTADMIAQAQKEGIEVKRI